MKPEGEALRIYIEEKHINKTHLAKSLKMSRTNLYQLFESKTLEEKTKNKICKYLRVAFEDIYNYRKIEDSIPDQESPISEGNEPDLHYQTEIFYLKQLLKSKEETIAILKSKLPDKVINDN